MTFWEEIKDKLGEREEGESGLMNGGVSAMVAFLLFWGAGGFCVCTVFAFMNS